MDFGKRQFLRGGSVSDELRPPWLADIASFTDSCTRCGKCIELCPENIICAGDGGFPLVEFGLGECTFCGDCTNQCEAGLFHPAATGEYPAWRHKALVSDHCLTNLGVMCRSCEDACEPMAIRFPLAAGILVPRPVIDIDACTGCGACVRPCPEQAIKMA
ncbi:MAG: ferredoxin-type protein NapF [Halioglobus sp.]